VSVTVVHDATDADIIAASLHVPGRFAGLYERYAAAVHRYAYRRVGPQVADDIVAETFLTAFRQRRRYDTATDNAQPWLFGIATREISRHRRTERARYRALCRVPEEPLGECLAERVATDVTAQRSHAALADALSRLATGDRDVLLLFAWGGLRYEEIATALRIPVGTVRSRLHRTRSRLRAALGGTDPTSIDQEM